MKFNRAVLFFAAALLCIIGSSCNKKYTCALNGMATEIYYAKDYTAAQLASFDTICVHGGGVWSVYNN